MEISDKMKDALNEQVNAELYSAYLYLSIAAYAEAKNFKGFAHWLKLQAQEELEHAMKIYNFIYERSGKVVLKEIKQPPIEWSSFKDMFKNVYEHEKHVTELIHNLVKLAREERDTATEVFLHWFVNGQVEEEDSARTIYEKLKLAEEKINILFMIDRELGSRKKD